MNQPRRSKHLRKSPSLFGVGWIHLLGGLFVCLILSLTNFCQSASAILRPMDSELNIRGMPLWRDGRWIMNKINAGTLFVVANNSRVKNISIFDTRPDQDYDFFFPAFHHGFQRNSKITCLCGCPWPHNCGTPFSRSGKK